MTTETRARLVLVALLLVAPLAAEAQPAPRPYRVGVVNEAFATHPTVEGLKAGLREAGLAEGRDVAFDVRERAIVLAAAEGGGPRGPRNVFSTA